MKNPKSGYSRQAVIAPFRGGSALMFRVINERDTPLFGVQARVIVEHRQRMAGRIVAAVGEDQGGIRVGRRHAV